MQTQQLRERETTSTPSLFGHMRDRGWLIIQRDGLARSREVSAALQLQVCGMALAGDDNKRSPDGPCEVSNAYNYSDKRSLFRALA